MQWKGRRTSRNVEDRRGGGRGAGGARIGGVGLIVVLALGYFLGVDVTQLLDPQGGRSSQTPQAATDDGGAGEFVAVTLADTEEVWQAVFREQLGREYRPAVMVLFSDVTGSPCGGAEGASGPFYCPADRKAYLDTRFFATLRDRLGAQGDFAAAYVVAHEIAHHVQNELGVLAEVHQLRRQVSEAQSNALSVRTELQADCLAGIWAREAEARLGTVEAGDLQEAVNAARQIGDDILQRNAGRRPVPHTFTHGTSEQRARWFVTGYRSGQMDDCDTFTAARL
ncbi:neutral zinc metallopeptidase [Szabonella alba]|uniref:Neutral zinc metallopeptidase n=1 Tax=Szabonella alba TaxID=2804194 RepID=A0A8K0Y0U1_9RHOB|nr:neutral zinc metallopeptidase [Szabonella alba]MBL4917478.1 neutral zinc metallopeptidase [Szabonella alba]